jgi:hypothetical protein
LIKIQKETIKLTKIKNKKRKKKEEKAKGPSFMPRSEFEIEFERESPPPFRHFQIVFPHDSMSRFNFFNSHLDEMTVVHI